MMSRNQRGRRVRTVYLPGDEQGVRMSEAFARERRPTRDEMRAASRAIQCATRRYWNPGRWLCKPDAWCVYCKEIFE
jgi:hypothetical protein